MPSLADVPQTRPGSVAVCAVGPGSLRLLGPHGVDQTSCEVMQLASIALAAEDDPVTLVGARPTSVAGLWETIFAELLGSRDVTAAELIHPTCWPAHRVMAVAQAAGRFVESVSTVPRSRASGAFAAFVEIAPSYVAVGGADSPLRLVDRASPLPEVLEQVLRLLADRAGTIEVDAPVGVPGAEEFGALLVRRLRESGRTVEVARLEGRCVTPPVRRQVAPTIRHGHRVRGFAAVSVGLALVGLVVGGMHLRRAAPIPPQGDAESKLLVEGELAVEIPADWTVQRITGGRGSDRVQATSSQDPRVAVHVTQSRLPATDLAATAAALADAMAAEPPGIFVEFNRADQRAGRPAVTYREVRSGHDIRWVILQDGDLRISIGCQSAPDGWTAVSAVCERALRSAHHVR